MKLSLQPTDLPDDPLAVFEHLVNSHDNCFLLETLGKSKLGGTSGKSYLGVGPRQVFTPKTGSSNAFLDLKRAIKLQPDSTDGFVGGLVGYTSHEAISQYESTIKFPYKRQFPDFQFGLYDDGLIFEGDSPKYFHYGHDRLSLYKAQNKLANDLKIIYKSAQKTSEQYEAMVKSAQDDIKNGRVFQVVLANRYKYEFSGSLINLYRKLREINPSEYMFFLKFGDVVVLGASPELLIHSTPERKLYLEALAGTIKRGKDYKEDEALAKQLLSDEKEIAEHSMLVDLARNDVGRVSAIGSVKIDDLMYIKKLSHVQHICTLVSGKLAKGKDNFDALMSTAPAGTLTGTPKIEAVKMIAELEGAERGAYGGTVGYFSYNGDSMHAVNIRSLSAAGNELIMHSGSGIVYDSIANKEAGEIAVKKTAMDKAMEGFLS